MTTNHSKIRFIGYPIPTTPANLVSIGDPNGPGAVAGTYLANNDVATDIKNRVCHHEKWRGYGKATTSKRRGPQ